METIGDRIRYLRNQHGLSQEKVADSIGKTKSNVSGYENDKFEPSAQTIIALCRLFNVSSDWLLFGKEDEVLILEQKEELKLSPEEMKLLRKIDKLTYEEKLKIEGIIEGFLLSHELNTKKKGQSYKSTNGEEAAANETA